MSASRKRSGKSRSGKRDICWSFGYGSNMDIEAIQTKKHVQLIEHKPAKLLGWKLSFSLIGIDNVEPAYACIQKGEESDVVEGVAFCMTVQSMAELDRTESGYNKEAVVLQDCEGNKFKGFTFALKPDVKTDDSICPSARYLNLVIKGAEKAMLSEAYIEQLKKMNTFKTSENVLAVRKSLKGLNQYPPMTVDEISKHDGSDDQETWVSCLGYVISTSSLFKSHKGRDITTRALYQYHGIGLDDNDDSGRAPYPIISDLSEDEIEYVSQWLDHYLMRDGGENKVVGHVKEFFEQQESGASKFKLPSNNNNDNNNQ